MLLARAGDQELQRLPKKMDGPVWHSGLSIFPDPRPFCLASGQHVHNGHLLRSSLRGQHPE
jgi:hypothetical protein